MPPVEENSEQHDDVQEPNLIVLGINYTKAIARWIAEGRPVRDEKEITRIFNEICLPCPYFNDMGQTCKVCGCRANRHGSALVNKIAMKSESCPKDKW